MIPDINQIIDGLLSGQYSRAQALAWLDQHMKLASESDDLRDHFAGLAMGGLLGLRTGEQLRSLFGDKESDPNPADLLAVHAYAIADAMLKARAA